MKKMYRTGYFGVTEVWVVKETPKMVWVAAREGIEGYSAMKHSSSHSYFNSWQEARLHLMLVERHRIIDLQAKLKASKSQLDRIVAMQDPTKTEEKIA